MEKTHRGIYKVTYELMEKFLKLDSDHKVIGMETGRDDFDFEGVKVKVDGPCMPEKEEGFPLQWVPLDQIDYVKGLRNEDKTS